MEFASAAAAARTSFQLTGRSHNSPDLFSYQLCLRVMPDDTRLNLTSSEDLSALGPYLTPVCGVTVGNSIQPPVARFEDFEVNLETGKVWKAGRPIKVQDQPFRVLAALLERPGQIVPREELRELI